MKNNNKVAIIGFGIEGRDAYRYFSKKGAEIGIYDRSDNDEIDLRDLELSSDQLHFGENYLKKGLKGYDLIVRSAGVRPDMSEIDDAKRSGAELTSTTKIFFDNFGGEIVGVTGTKGKGTTSTLIYEMLRKSGKKVALAGNIGEPVLDILNADNHPEIVVLELSSFQLMDLHKSPHIAVVLNITLDHMDWHKSEQEYKKSKENIVRHQSKEDFAVINNDYENSKRYQKLTEAKIYFFSKQKQVKGCYVSQGNIILDTDRKIKIAKTDDLILRGEHNWENATAASLAAYLSGADIDSIRSILLSFKGLEHRLEFVKEISGIKFYNDSFSTTIHTTLAAVNSFDEDITLILGGFDKGLDYKKLVEELVKQKNLKNILLIGDIGERYEAWLEQEAFEGKMINMGDSDMKNIVKKASEVTNKGGVVVLSPSTSSFDMFKSYKQRGERFKEAVNKL